MTVAALSPVWANSGDKLTAPQLAARVNAGFVEETVSLELMNSIVDREEAKINEIVAQLPDDDELDAIQGAATPSSTNVFQTAADSLKVYDYENYVSITDHFTRVNPDNGYYGYWVMVGDAGDTYSVGELGGVLTMNTDGDSEDAASIQCENLDESNVSKNPTVAARIKLTQTTACKCTFGLYKDANEYILFEYDSTVDGNWHTKTNDAGSETTDQNDQGSVAADTDWVILKFVVTGGGTSIAFYIDGALKATHTSDILSADIGRRFYIQTSAAATKSAAIDVFHQHQEV